MGFSTHGFPSPHPFSWQMSHLNARSPLSPRNALPLLYTNDKGDPPGLLKGSPGYAGLGRRNGLELLLFQEFLQLARAGRAQEAVLPVAVGIEIDGVGHLLHAEGLEEGVAGIGEHLDAVELPL